LAIWKGAWGKEYRQNYSSDPARERSWFRDALAEAEELDDWAPGVSFCDSLIAWEPNESRWRLARGVGRLALGRSKEAVEDLEIAARAGGPAAKAWERLAQAYTNLGRYQDAVNAYSKALDLEPKNFLHWLYRGVVRKPLRQWKAAADDL